MDTHAPTQPQTTTTTNSNNTSIIKNQNHKILTPQPTTPQPTTTHDQKSAARSLGHIKGKALLLYQTESDWIRLRRIWAALRQSTTKRAFHHLGSSVECLDGCPVHIFSVKGPHIVCQRSAIRSLSLSLRFLRFGKAGIKFRHWPMLQAWKIKNYPF